MIPTIAEIVFWSLTLIGAILFFLFVAYAGTTTVPDDDPYRFCPKDEENA